MIRRASTWEEDSVRNHLLALGISSELTETWRRMYRPMAAKVHADEVIRVLYEAGIRPVVMGTHGLGGYRSEPRATVDVDVLVRKKEIRKAVRCLRQRYPELEVTDTPVVTRFRDPTIGKVVIDVMKPTQAIYQMVFRHLVSAGETHDIPELEMALASKFAAMTSPHRDPAKKLIDAGDFLDVVRHNRQAIDMAKLKRLANRVYPDGAAEIVRLVEDIDAGRTIQV